MTDPTPLDETGRVSITNGMANAMVHYGAARQCDCCGFGCLKYPGQYPHKCPRGGCDGKLVAARATESVEMDQPVVCVSRTHRIQQLIEGGQRSFKPYGPSCSHVTTIRYAALESCGGPDVFKTFLEGPVEDGHYYRVESVEDPVLIFEFDDTSSRLRIFAADQPGRYLSWDPREDIVKEDHEGTFEPAGSEAVRMVDVGHAGLSEAIDPVSAGNLQLFASDSEARDIAERIGLDLEPSSRLIGEETLWILVHESTGYALGRGEVRRLEEFYGSGPGAPTYNSATYGPERVRARHRAVDKTHQRVAGAFAEDSRSSIKNKRKPGEGHTQVRGGFRIHVGKNKDRSPRKDVQKSLQNKWNVKRRGLRAQIAGSKKWHRSREGQDLHRVLGDYNRSRGESHDIALRHRIMDVKDRITRYNAGATRKIGAAVMAEDIGNLRPRSQGGTDQMTARGPQNLENPTPDDHLEAVLRRLIVTQDLDVLQDVEFDENTGSVYLFFDPILMPDEVEEILQAVRQERGDIELIASPDMSLPGESVESEWWVMFLAGPGEFTEPDPSIYARTPEQYATRVQAVVMTEPSPPEAAAQGIDVNKLMKAARS